MSYTPHAIPPTDKIRLGDILTVQSGQESTHSTLSTIFVDRGYDSVDLYGITAGHVLVGDQKVIVTHRVTGVSIEGENVPLKTTSDADPMMDEVGIMRFCKSDKEKFCGIVSRLGLKHFDQFIEDDEAMQPLFRGEETRYEGLMAALKREQVTYVHKDGTSACLSTARLGTIEWDFLSYQGKMRTRRTTIL